jgi:hypothetical protein
MADGRCPGQDLRTWKPTDIYDVPCPHCQTMIEFWKDERLRTCPQCRRAVPNPRVSRACEQWCSHSQECQAPPPPAPETKP